MRIVGPTRSLRAIVIAGFAMTLALPASGSTPSSQDHSTPAAIDPVANAPTGGQALDVSAGTVRDAARSAARTSNDGATDRDPGLQVNASRPLLPACNGWVDLAEFTVLAAACLTNHCGDPAQTGYSPVPLAPVNTAPRPTRATCLSKGVKLW